MAIEYGATLATLLTSGIPPDEVPRRLKLYEELQKPSVARVRETARIIAKGLEDRELLQRYHVFLKEYDAVECAKERLLEYLEARK
jgi:hypothetical protein